MSRGAGRELKQRVIRKLQKTAADDGWNLDNMKKEEIKIVASSMTWKMHGSSPPGKRIVTFYVLSAVKEFLNIDQDNTIETDHQGFIVNYDDPTDDRTNLMVPYPEDGVPRQQEMPNELIRIGYEARKELGLGNWRFPVEDPDPEDEDD